MLVDERAGRKMIFSGFARQQRIDQSSSVKCHEDIRRVIARQSDNGSPELFNSVAKSRDDLEVERKNNATWDSAWFRDDGTSLRFSNVGGQGTALVMQETCSAPPLRSIVHRVCQPVVMILRFAY